MFSKTGVSGATIKFDKFGDSEGNFSVLALKKDPFRRNNFSCDYQMKPVGQFQQGETLVSELFTAFLRNHSLSRSIHPPSTCTATTKRRRQREI